MRALGENPGQGAEVEASRSKRSKRLLELLSIVSVAMILVHVEKVLQPVDGLAERIVEGGAVVAPDIFNRLEELLFHDGTDQLTV
jgi:hypothetical protein